MLAVLAISSCVKETPVEPQTQPAENLMTITLSTEIQSKTTMTPGATKLSWTSGDKFDLFSNGGDRKTTPEYVSDDAAIEAGVDQGATEIYAIYPSVAANTKSAVTVNIPASQTQAVAGQMNGSNIPMHAKGTIEDNSAVLSFRPVAGIIALNVYSTDATDAKVKKVQINPLDAEGNFIYSGYCGSVTVAADEFSYDPNEDVNGVTLTLGTPCGLPSEKPSDQAATLNFANQLYIGITRGTYAGLQFIVTTDDGKMYVATSRTERSFENTDIHYINLNIAGKDEISDDFYGQYNAGLDLTICGNVINKKTHPKSKLVTEVISSASTDLTSSLEESGILFLDSSNLTSPDMRKAATTINLGKDKIIIGRYRNAKQPLLRITKDAAYSWTFDGNLMMKNIHLASFITTRSLLTGLDNGTDGANLFFEDCTLTSTGTGGILLQAVATWEVPASLRFDNCILRANAEFFSASGKDSSSNQMASMQTLKNITFNNCVFAPATVTTSDDANSRFTNSKSVTRLAKNGALIALYNPNHKFDDLTVNISYCSFYDLGPASQARGIIDATTVKSVSIDHSMFHHSTMFANMYLTNVLQNCTAASYNVSATYSNAISGTKMSYGPKSKFTANGGTCNATITEQNTLFGDCQPEIHYFPKDASFTNLGGASYDTKYWIVPTPAAE